MPEDMGFPERIRSEELDTNFFRREIEERIDKNGASVNAVVQQIVEDMKQAYDPGKTSPNLLTNISVFTAVVQEEKNRPPLKAKEMNVAQKIKEFVPRMLLKEKKSIKEDDDTIKPFVNSLRELDEVFVSARIDQLEEQQFVTGKLPEDQAIKYASKLLKSFDAEKPEQNRETLAKLRQAGIEGLLKKTLKEGQFTGAEQNKIAKVLVSIYGIKAHKIVQSFIKDEIAITENPGNIFRTDSLTTRMLREFLLKVLPDFNNICIQPIAMKARKGLESDTTVDGKVMKRDVMDGLNKISVFSKNFPKEVRATFRILYNEAKEKIKNKTSAKEMLSPKFSIESEAEKHVFAAFMLRYVNPAILNPKQYGVDNTMGLHKNAQMMTTILQCIANETRPRKAGANYAYVNPILDDVVGFAADYKEQIVKNLIAE